MCGGCQASGHILKSFQNKVSLLQFKHVTCNTCEDTVIFLSRGYAVILIVPGKEVVLDLNPDLEERFIVNSVKNC